MDNENLNNGENIENKGPETTIVNPESTDAGNIGTDENVNLSAENQNSAVIENNSNVDNASEKITEINIDNNIAANNNETAVTEETADVNGSADSGNASANKKGVFASALDAVNNAEKEKEQEEKQEENIPEEPQNVVHKVLIIEDNEAERNSLRAALEAESFVVEAVESGFDAENLVRVSIFDVAIVDYRLPDIDGLNLIKKLKISIPELMSLVVTAHSSVEIAVEALRMGAYDYITKPLNIPALAKTISTMIEERDIAVASRKKLIELQSKGGITYKYNDELVSVITTPNPDMLVTGEAKVGLGKKIKRAVEAVKNFYWGS